MHLHAHVLSGNIYDFPVLILFQGCAGMLLLSKYYCTYYIFYHLHCAANVFGLYGTFTPHTYDIVLSVLTVCLSLTHWLHHRCRSRKSTINPVIAQIVPWVPLDDVSAATTCVGTIKFTARTCPSSQCPSSLPYAGIPARIAWVGCQRTLFIDGHVCPTDLPHGCLRKYSIGAAAEELPRVPRVLASGNRCRIYRRCPLRRLLLRLPPPASQDWRVYNRR